MYVKDIAEGLIKLLEDKEASGKIYEFGGASSDTRFENRILELRVGSNSWNILNITLKNGRCKHVVIPFQ